MRTLRLLRPWRIYPSSTLIRWSFATPLRKRSFPFDHATTFQIGQYAIDGIFHVNLINPQIARRLEDVVAFESFYLGGNDISNEPLAYPYVSRKTREGAG